MNPTGRGPIANRPALRLRPLWAVGVMAAALEMACGVAAASPADVPPFRTGILPLLTKAGCNAGACHGAATGQGGFKLSLLGYDPEEDHLRITRELAGRRIDLTVPTDSLILRKPSRQLDHEGGRRLPRGSSAYTAIARWIAAGAPYGPRDLRVESIRVSPEESLIDQPGQSFPLRVTARWSDGTSHDVTELCLFTSNDDAIADVDPAGIVKVTGRGQTGAAQDLCTGLPDRHKCHYVQPRVGHYGVFNGSRFRNHIQPRMRDFIRAERSMVRG